MQAEIITIGDELLIGQVADTNAQYLAKALTRIGLEVSQITTIKDSKEHILSALEKAQNHNKIVLITGGLGPTKDDVTKQTFCAFFNDTLVENKEVTAHIHKLFKTVVKKEPLPEVLDQAKVPSKAILFFNAYGTASGMGLVKGNTTYIAMPGVPYEMKKMMEHEVIPYIQQTFNTPFISYKTLLTYGLGESEVARRIESWESELPKNISLAYLPSPGRVRLRITVHGNNEKEVEETVAVYAKQLKNLLDDIAIGFENDISLPQAIGQALVQKQCTLAIAESCTGGALAKQFTTHPGASAFFKGSITAYATAIKVNVLEIDNALIEKYTVVSKEVAQEMAEKARKLFNTQYAIATTGEAGPDLGENSAEVGEVFIAIATPEKTICEKFSLGKSREQVINKAVNKAMELLFREISKN